MSTKISEIKKTGKFTWGEPWNFYEIGPYTILKFHLWEFKDGHKTGEISSEWAYHGWIDGEDAHESWPSLETAITGLIGRKYAGPNNGGVGYYFCKMVDAPPYDKTKE